MFSVSRFPAWVAMAAMALALVLAPPELRAESLPFATVFKGESRFDQLVARARKEQWAKLPIGERTARVGLALVGTPYVNYTLEIDDRIEAPSVNLQGLDCWTFFEVALAFARLIKLKPDNPHPADLLALVELDRYRAGSCTGSYLSRLHFLEDWMVDNERRGLIHNVTPDLGGIRMPYRLIREMSVGWKHYRYLRENPSLRDGIAQVEKEVSRLPVYFIPKSRVAAAESSIASGDIIHIATSWKGSYTSHVGLALRDKKGVLRFMHATSERSKGRQVIIDRRLSTYLSESASRAGIMVARPFDIPPSVALPRHFADAQ